MLRATLLRSLIITFIIAATSGCSYLASTANGIFGSEPSKETSKKSGSITQDTARLNDTDTSIDGVEVVWEVPSESMDSFIIRYGYQRANLEKEISVSVKDLKVINDPEFGKVYRYVVQPIDKKRSVFVSVASVKGKVVSDFSEVIEEKAR